MARITRLLVDGSIDSAYPSFVTKGYISASFSAEFEDGDEINEKNASGEVCIAFKGDDSLTRISFNLALCTPDPEAAALLAGGKVIVACAADIPNDVAVGDVIGYSSPAVGDTVGNPVAIEIWSIANVGGKPATGYPYWHWAFPYVKVRYEGDREFSNGALANEYTGQGLGNDALAEGGGLDYVEGDEFATYAEALLNPFSYVRASELPTEGWSGALTLDDENSIDCVPAS
jgi:hypothetical protein